MQRFSTSVQHRDLTFLLNIPWPWDRDLEIMDILFWKCCLVKYKIGVVFHSGIDLGSPLLLFSEIRKSYKRCHDTESWKIGNFAWADASFCEWNYNNLFSTNASGCSVIIRLKLKKLELFIRKRNPMVMVLRWWFEKQKKTHKRIRRTFFCFTPFVSADVIKATHFEHGKSLGGRWWPLSLLST